MSKRDELLKQIRNGKPMVVGGGGDTVRSEDSHSSGVPIKKHTWG